MTSASSVIHYSRKWKGMTGMKESRKSQGFRLQKRIASTLASSLAVLRGCRGGHDSKGCKLMIRSLTFLWKDKWLTFTYLLSFSSCSTSPKGLQGTIIHLVAICIFRSKSKCHKRKANHSVWKESQFTTFSLYLFQIFLFRSITFESFRKHLIALKFNSLNMEKIINIMGHFWWLSTTVANGFVAGSIIA